MALDNPGVQNGKYMPDGISEVNKREMYDTFQSWALQNYGDSGKTKTVTRKKYNRIVRILTGEEESSTENSKFRFWVKAKGFRLGPKNGHHGGQNVLYVPVKQTVSLLLYILHVYIFIYINTQQASNVETTLIQHWFSVKTVQRCVPAG